MSQGLSGLGQALQQYGQLNQQRKKEEEMRARLQAGGEAAKAAYESGDPNAMAKVALEYPELSQGLERAYNFRSEATKQNMLQGMRRVLSGEDANAVFEDRVRQVAEAGGDPSDTVREWQTYRENPEASLNNIKMAYASMDPKGYQAMFGGDGGSKVGAQEILEDGTVIQSTPQGPVVWSPSGERLSGAEAVKAVRQGRQYGVSNQRDIYSARREGTLGADINLGSAAEGAKAAGKQAIEKSGEAFDQLANIDSNMSNLDEAVRLLDEGAQTGLVVGRLPSVSKASRELDNLQARLGLDVIGNTTFGALSESELNFALNTALPKDLPPAELRQWLIRKKEAQGKLRDYLQQAAIFLGTPGNTVADWAQIQQEQQPAQSGDVESLLEKYR